MGMVDNAVHTALEMSHQAEETLHNAIGKVDQFAHKVWDGRYVHYVACYIYVSQVFDTIVIVRNYILIHQVTLAKRHGKNLSVSQ